MKTQSYKNVLHTSKFDEIILETSFAIASYGQYEKKLG